MFHKKNRGILYTKGDKYSQQLLANKFLLVRGFRSVETCTGLNNDNCNKGP